MRGDKGGARLAGGRSGGRGRDRGAGGLGAPGAGAGGGESRQSGRVGALFWRGGRRLGWRVKKKKKGLRGEAKEGLGAVGGNGSKNEMRRIKGRQG